MGDLGVRIGLELVMSSLQLDQRALHLLEFLQLGFELDVVLVAHGEQGLVFGERGVILILHVAHDGKRTVKRRRGVRRARARARGVSLGVHGARRGGAENTGPGSRGRARAAGRSAGHRGPRGTGRRVPSVGISYCAGSCDG